MLQRPLWQSPFEPHGLPAAHLGLALAQAGGLQVPPGPEQTCDPQSVFASQEAPSTPRAQVSPAQLFERQLPFVKLHVVPAAPLWHVPPVHTFDRQSPATTQSAIAAPSWQVSPIPPQLFERQLPFVASHGVPAPPFAHAPLVHTFERQSPATRQVVPAPPAAHVSTLQLFEKQLPLVKLQGVPG
jgi:hypothetical protein